MQIAAQLPESIVDARAILEYARELVDMFLAGHVAEKVHAPAVVLPFSSSASALSDKACNNSK